MNAVDTNVLLYAVDEDEPAKRKRAREFLRQLGRSDGLDRIDPHQFLVDIPQQLQHLFTAFAVQVADRLIGE